MVQSKVLPSGWLVPQPLSRGVNRRSNLTPHRLSILTPLGAGPPAPPSSEAIASLASTTQKAPKTAGPGVAVAFAILGHNSANATMTFCLPGTPRQVFGLITKWRLFESHSNSRKLFASPVPRGARLHFSHYNLPPPASRHRAGRPARQLPRNRAYTASRRSRTPPARSRETRTMS